MGGQFEMEQYHNIEVVNCADSLSVEELENCLKGQQDLSLPAGESWCLLGFGEAIDLQSIKIQFVKENITKVEIVSTDQTAVKQYDKFNIEKNNLDIRSAYIKIIFNSQEINSIHKINIFGSAAANDYMKEENEIILDGNDKNNPLYPYRIPVKQCIYTLAGEILGKKAASMTTHEKIVCFMDYISEFQVGPVAKYKSGEYLQRLVLDRIGACGDYSNLLAALCATQGVETRLITLGNFPKGSGHAVIEILADGKWSVYDPTYAAYYTTTPDETKTPYVLSFEELKNGQGKEQNVTRIIGNESHILGETSYLYIGPEIYEEASPAGIVSPKNKLCYPMEYMYQSGGMVDIREYQGASYLGAADINNAHLWKISGLSVGKLYKFTLVDKGIAGEYFDAMKTYVDLNYGTIESGSVKEWSGTGQEEWNIVFMPNRSDIELKLDHKETGEQLHYIAIESIAISEVTLED